MALIIALDFDNQKQAFNLIDQLDPKYCTLKIGSELFTHFGPQFVQQCIAKKFKIFLDLKFHDIPNTVARACKAAADLGVWMLNVHALGGIDMMSAARQALESFGQERPFLIAVTVLTSFKENDLPSIGIDKPLVTQVNHLANLAKLSGLDGVVCSAHEASSIKISCGSAFITVTPGIRLPDNDSHDQSRIMTPEKAIKAGSDYLVIGRPITQSVDPALVVRNIVNSINAA